jgi:hypothetical protein
MQTIDVGRPCHPVPCQQPDPDEASQRAGQAILAEPLASKIEFSSFEARAAALEAAPQTVSQSGAAAAQPPDPAEGTRIAALRPPPPGKSEPQTE